MQTTPSSFTLPVVASLVHRRRYLTDAPRAPRLALVGLIASADAWLGVHVRAARATPWYEALRSAA